MSLCLDSVPRSPAVNEGSRATSGRRTFSEGNPRYVLQYISELAVVTVLFRRGNTFVDGLTDDVIAMSIDEVSTYMYFVGCVS